MAALVGRRIADLRRSAGLSLSELARQAGLGKGTLSELEAGRRNPTLGTLYSLTAPLGVGLARLIDLGPSPRTARGAVSGDGITALLLDVLDGPGALAVTEVYRLTIAPGAERTSPAHGPGVREQLTVVSGRAVVGPVDRPVAVAAGETVTWMSDVPHYFGAAADSPTVGVLLIEHPDGPHSGPAARVAGGDASVRPPPVRVGDEPAVSGTVRDVEMVLGPRVEVEGESVRIVEDQQPTDGRFHDG